MGVESNSGARLSSRNVLRRGESLKFRRRMAFSYSAVGILFAAGLVWYLQRPICRTQNCVPAAVIGGLVILLPTIWLVAWWLGRIYRDQAETVAARLGRMLETQLESLETERLRLETVLLQMADGVMLTDDTGRVRFINPAAAKLLKTDEGAANGHSFAEVAYHYQLIDLWQKCRTDRKEQTAAVEIERRGFFIQTIISPVQSEKNLACIVILQDLTRIRRLETIRRDFISNVSHELLTPISSLRALVETLQDGAMDDPQVANRFLSKAQGEVDAITQIVSELLTLSRIESGQVTLRMVPTEVSELLLPPVERLLAPADRKGIEMVVDVPAGSPAVLADPEQIWQVVTNIVHNAIKYTDEGGRITVSAKPSVKEVVFTVKDTGAGIPKDDLPRIFERFYKADRSRQRAKVGGTGLGLSIAKHIVQAHDGRIWAKSKEGKGSTFYFALPVVDELS